MPRIRPRPTALALFLGILIVIPFAAGNVTAGVSRPVDVPSERELPFRVNTALLPNSKENTNAIAQNDGNAAATIVMDFYTPGGVLIPGASQVFTNVAPGATRTFVQALNTGLIPGFRGVGVLSSDQPINALLVRDIEGPGGVKSYSIHSANAQGGTTVAVPFVANKLDGVFNVRFAIANVSTAVACVTVEYAFVPGAGTTPAGGKAPLVDNGPGGSGCANGYPIPVGGQVTFAPTSVDGATPMPGGTAGALMSATVESNVPVTVAVDAYREPNQGRELGSYDGFVVGSMESTTDDVSTDVILPIALKTADGFWSQFLLSNPWNTDATATIVYTGSVNGGPTQSFTVTVNVPANGVNNHGVYSGPEFGDVIPVGFLGAARMTSNVPLAVVLFRGKETSAGSGVSDNLYTAVNGVPAERAATTAKFPLIFRRVYQSGGFSGFNSWVSVSVANGGTANVTLTTVNDTTTGAPGCGNPATYVSNRQITGSFVFFQNLDDTATNGLGALPSCLWGGMVITSDQPIIAIALVTTDLLPGDNDGLYNAFD